jgi:hypothetical protein
MSRIARSAKPADVAKSRRSTTVTKQPSSPDSDKPEQVTTIEPHDGRVIKESKFAINAVVKVPASIHESKQATICGKEWGPDNWRAKSSGWAYYLDLGPGPWWLASEEELIKWGNK